MNQDPLAVQHGGNHYKGMGIQPIEFASANGYDPSAFSTLKYLSRHHLKHGREDVLKGSHFVEIRLKFLLRGEYPIQRATSLIPVEAYISTNHIAEHSAAILRNLHQWTQQTSRVGDKTAASLILQQIDHLLETLYPQEKG